MQKHHPVVNVSVTGTVAGYVGGDLDRRVRKGLLKR